MITENSVWTNIIGEQIRLKDLDDIYMNNIINLLIRRLSSRVFYSSARRRLGDKEMLNFLTHMKLQRQEEFKKLSIKEKIDNLCSYLYK